MNASHQNGLAKLEATRERCKWLFRIRPQSLATPLFKLFCPYERRTIVPVEGLQLYLDPLSHLAGDILSEGTYEASTVALFRDTIRPGDTVLDIGANEGFFSALADGRIGTLLLDYHASILARAGVDPAPLHDAIVNAGYAVINREKDGYDGYVLYRHRE